MERRARIELATLAWKAKVIPFYERRVYCNYTTNCQACLYCLAGDIGFEPMHVGIKIRCLNQLGESPTKTYCNTLNIYCQECVLKHSKLLRPQ